MSESALTGADYNRLVEVLHAAHKRQPGLEKTMQVSVVAMNFCAALEKQDPGFDQVRFMRAVREGLLYDPAAVDEDRPPCSLDAADLDTMLQDEQSEGWQYGTPGLLGEEPDNYRVLVQVPGAEPGIWQTVEAHEARHAAGVADAVQRFQAAHEGHAGAQLDVMVRAEDVRVPAVLLFGLLSGVRKNMWSEDREPKEFLRQLDRVAEEFASILPENSPAEHNHMTRDIKPQGQCPRCDLLHR